MLLLQLSGFELNFWKPYVTTAGIMYLLHIFVRTWAVYSETLQEDILEKQTIHTYVQCVLRRLKL